MTRIALAVALLASPASAGSWCGGVIASNGDCLITESPRIVRCNYDTPGCVGATDRRQIFDADVTVTTKEITPPRRHRERR